MPATRKATPRSASKATPRSASKATPRSTSKATSRSAATTAARDRAEDNVRRLENITKSLEAAQTDLAGIGGSLGTGVSDLRRDANRLLRDARRDLDKMRRAVQRDLERLQKNLASAATGKPPASPRKAAVSKRAVKRAAS